MIFSVSTSHWTHTGTCIWFLWYFDHFQNYWINSGKFSRVNFQNYECPKTDQERPRFAISHKDRLKELSRSTILAELPLISKLTVFPEFLPWTLFSTGLNLEYSRKHTCGELVTWRKIGVVVAPGDFHNSSEYRDMLSVFSSEIINSVIPEIFPELISRVNFRSY